MKLKHWLGAFAVAALLIASANDNQAQNNKPLDKKAQDLALLNGALKEVINAGAKIFNDHGDHAGCYRLYQGSLLSVKPYLSPELQKSIDAGIANADMKASFADRAFELRRVLDEIRSKTNSVGIAAKKDSETKNKETTPDKGTEIKKDKEIANKGTEIKKDKEIATKGTEPKKDKETTNKGTEPKKDKEIANKGTENKKNQGIIIGKITYQGEPIKGGYAVTLVAADGKRVSGIIQKDGTFQVKAPLAPGDYRVIVEPIPGEAVVLQLPMRYTSERTSGIMIRVQAGKQELDLNLVK